VTLFSLKFRELTAIILERYCRPRISTRVLKFDFKVIEEILKRQNWSAWRAYVHRARLTTRSVTAHGATRWLLTAETCVRSRCLRCGRSDTAAGFPPCPVPPLSPSLHTHLSPPHEVCDSPDQAAHHRTLGTNWRASCLIQYLAGIGIKVWFSYFTWRWRTRWTGNC
jgi:hypothetical protein